MIATQHSNFVHHAALDPSGTLLATCSSDKTVEVFYRAHHGDTTTMTSSSSSSSTDVESSARAATWTRGCVIRDHSGPVVRLAWSPHVEHGPLLATAGADQWLYLYRVTIATLAGRQTVVHAERWTTHRGFEKDAITGVAFVPPQQHHLLLLSTSSLDGLVRLYEVRRQSQIVFFARVIPEEQCSTDAATRTQTSSGNTSTATTTAAARVGADAGGGKTSNAGKGGAVGSARAPSSSTMTATAMTPSRRSGITAIAWFAGAAETGMTLAAGTVSGRCLLFRFRIDSSTFCPIALPRTLQHRFVCHAAIEDVKWAPPVGRRFQLLAVCSRSAVLILRVHCISPSNADGGATMTDNDNDEADNDNNDDRRETMYELYRHAHGAVSAEWSRSATLLYLVSDDTHMRFSVLQMRNPLDHQSWHVVAHDTTGNMYAPAGMRGGLGEPGYCALHHRKRARIDLVPLDDVADASGVVRMRCRPMHECRPRELNDVTLVTCHLHNKRRNILQMREVQPGVWECQSNAVCRFYGGMASSSNGGGGGMPVASPTPYHAYGHALPGDAIDNNNNNNNMSTYDAPPTTWSADVADMTAANSSALAPSTMGVYGDAAGAAAALLSERKVWCALHGKRLPERLCVLAEDCCYFCRDATLCLSTPLDAAADALAYGCTELLCARHHTLRSAGFVDLDASRTFYVCVAGHTCTHVTLPGLRRAQESSMRQQQQQQQLQPSLSYAAAAAAGTTGGGVDVDGHDAASSGRDAVGVSAFLL